MREDYQGELLEGKILAKGNSHSPKKRNKSIEMRDKKLIKIKNLKMRKAPKLELLEELYPGEVENGML